MAYRAPFKNGYKDFLRQKRRTKSGTGYVKQTHTNQKISLFEHDLYSHKHGPSDILRSHKGKSMWSPLAFQPWPLYGPEALNSLGSSGGDKDKLITQTGLTVQCIKSQKRNLEMNRKGDKLWRCQVWNLLEFGSAAGP